MRNPRSVVPLSEIGKYAVNRPGQQEALYQPLYDYQTYAAAGQTSLTFFAIPQGQGGKTIHDTNMETASALPNPKTFLIQGIEIVFFSGVVPGIFGAQAAATYLNDVNAVHQSGHVQLFIGSKPYLDEAPIGVFPPSFRLGGMAALADTTTAAADAQSRIDYATMAGATYSITPFFLPSQQNFKVTVDWPAVVALPSTVAGRIGVRLLGTLYRNSQ